jgi:hypothetical protein
MAQMRLLGLALSAASAPQQTRSRTAAAHQCQVRIHLLLQGCVGGSAYPGNQVCALDNCLLASATFLASEELTSVHAVLLLCPANTPGSRQHSFFLNSAPSHTELQPPIEATELQPPIEATELQPPIEATELQPPIEASDEDDWEDDEQSLLSVGRQPSYGIAGGRAGSSSSPSYSLGRALAGLRLQQLWHGAEVGGKGESLRAAAAAGVGGGGGGGVQVLPDAGLPLEQGVAEAAARHRR